MSPHRAQVLLGCVCRLGHHDVVSVLTTKVHKVWVVLLDDGLVSHLVSPLLDRLHIVHHDGGLGDLPHWRSHEVPGLGEAEAVGHGWGSGHRGNGSSNRDGVVCGERWDGSCGIGSNTSSGVGVGDGAVQENLGLGVGRGDSKNNLRL
jgi:hypothetical protein